MRRSLVAPPQDVAAIKPADVKKKLNAHVKTLARMVDVGQKPVTARLARARARVRMQPETLAKIQQGEVAKGDVLVVVRKRGAWWLARDAAGNEGLVPSNYVVGPDATPGGGAASASQA